MILVMLGTQNNSFERLIKEIDRLVENKIIQEEVIVQSGYTEYKPKNKNIKMIDFMPREKLNQFEQDANFIITHGGVGSIITSLEKRKKVIAIPRLHQYGEHVNDHQKEIVQKFHNNGNIIGIQSVENLEEAVKKIKNFQPKTYKPNNKKMLDIIENFIDSGTILRKVVTKKEENVLSQTEKIQKKKIKSNNTDNNIKKNNRKSENDTNKNLFKKILNSSFNSVFFPILIGILLLLKSIFFYSNTISIRETIDEDTIRGTIAFLATVICMICALPNRGRIATTIVVDGFLSVLLFADNLYHTYSSSVLSVAQIMNLQYGEEIISTIPMLIQAKEIIYFFDIFLIIIMICTKFIKMQKKNSSNLIKKFSKISVGIIAIVIFFKIDIEFIEKTKEDPYNKDTQIKKSTIYGYHISDIENTINIKKQAIYSTKQSLLYDYNRLKEDYNEKYGDINYDLQGVAKGKNFIILQLESIQNFVINKEINGKEITPNLNKFFNENIELSNMFMQSYSSTADSEFSAITSLYPMENGMSYSRYYTNTYDNIFSMFKDEGYETSYMHGNYGFFWNRENVYKKFGVENIELKDSFEDTSEEIMGYLSDELLYIQAVEKLKTYNMPFMSYIVSASSHTAFTLDGINDRSKISIDVGQYKDSFFGNYLESVNYADYAFGIFVEELKKADLYDDTVILVFGDHNGLDMYNEEMLDFLRYYDNNLNDTDIKLNYIRVASAIKIPGMENMKIEKPISKLDIKPTFAFLIDGEEGISLGTNIFARKDFICLNNERIVTDIYYFDEKWYYIKDGTEIIIEEMPQDERELLEDYYKQMRKELDISISISINNLLK